jgi:hypothetical protein
MRHLPVWTLTLRTSSGAAGVPRWSQRGQGQVDAVAGRGVDDGIGPHGEHGRALAVHPGREHAVGVDDGAVVKADPAGMTCRRATRSVGQVAMRRRAAFPPTGQDVAEAGALTAAGADPRLGELLANGPRCRWRDSAGRAGIRCRGTIGPRGSRRAIVEPHDGQEPRSSDDALGPRRTSGRGPVRLREDADVHQPRRLYSVEIDPWGRQIGNFLQAFTPLALLADHDAWHTRPGRSLFVLCGCCSAASWVRRASYSVWACPDPGRLRAL